MTAYTLNLLDLAITLYALKHGGVELNPLMQCVPVMVAHKTLVTGALCLWLKRVANTENALPNTASVLAKYGLWAITAVYAGIIIWHLINLI